MDTEQTELVLNLDQLKDLTRRTIGHYEFNAESYRQGTADHDVSQNYEALLDSIESKKPFKILDLGCGDFKWMSSFLNDVNYEFYLGLDIVDKLIDNNIKTCIYLLVQLVLHP